MLFLEFFIEVLLKGGLDVSLPSRLTEYFILNGLIKFNRSHYYK